MKVSFTNHALKRLKKRKILLQDVYDALKYPQIISKKRGKYLFQKRLSNGTIELCCEKTENNIKVITLYWI